jgi:hypothetical protein
MENMMNCQEFDKKIQPFIDHELDYGKMEEFLKHYKSCRECREELEIHFLMSYVLLNEDVTSINLAEVMEDYIQGAVKAKNRYYRRTLFQILIYLITNVAAVIAAVKFLLLVL